MEKLYALHLTKNYSGDEIKKSGMARVCDTYGESRDACNVLMGNPVRKRPLGIPRRRCECNIKMVVHEVRWGFMAWIDLAQDRDRWRAVVIAVMKFWVPKRRGYS
jgi:hypothetical protein